LALKFRDHVSAPNQGNLAKVSIMRGIDFLTIASVALVWIGVTVSHEQSYDAPMLDKILDGRIAGKAVNCLPARSVRPRRAIDRTAVDCAIGDALYVNHPSSGVELPSASKTLVARTRGSQLCSGEVVDPVDPRSHLQAGSVALGEFVPYRKLTRSTYFEIYLRP
jgi:hypothetical protein